MTLNGLYVGSENPRKNLPLLIRAFARLPVLNGTSRDGARQCAWFHDLRFALPELPPAPQLARQLALQAALRQARPLEGPAQAQPEQ